MTDPSPPGFARRFHVGWNDVDANRHMANLRYLAMAADVRVMYFSAHGFPAAEFARLQIGPVIKSEQLEYFRELHLLDQVRVTLLSAGLSDDASRFRIRNEFWRDDGALAARVTSQGGWLDLRARKLAPPPEALAAALRAIPRAPDFAVIPTTRDP
jgi:acyl-CoA thioester hydrolase